jgi:hypothetical protein
MSDERRYTEEEMRANFERAAGRQQARGRGGEVGLTLAELQEVGEAAGLDPADVAAAAGELVAGPTARPTVLGLTAEVTRSRVLPGLVSDEAWGALVADLRRTFKANGVTSEVGRVRAWASAASENELPVRASLEPEPEGVRLTLTQRPGELVAVLTTITTGLLGILGVATLLFQGDGGAVGAVILALAAAAYLAVRFLYGRSLRRTEAEFEAALERAEALVARGEAEREAPAALLARKAAPRLDLDALPEVEREPEPAPRTRTRA